MIKKMFSAQQWLQKDSESSASDTSSVTKIKQSAGRFPIFTRIQSNRVHQLDQNEKKFTPLNCFVPGWRGDALTSKSVHKFEKILNLVQQDVKFELLRSKDFTKSIKMGLYNEFLAYADSLDLHFEGVDDFTSFWKFIDPEKCSENEKIGEFIEIYCGRIATITFLKLRFVGTLIDQCGLEITDKALLYPTSFLSQLFRKGSQTELHSRAFESNHFSWYRPLESMRENMKELLILSKDLAISEIIKNVSARTQITSTESKVYSHALSNLSFGLFLNALQINFPTWLSTIENKPNHLHGMDQDEIISCKYFGDYLESLSLSHWLAQENNIQFKWDEMLCPDFKGKDFSAGIFTKVCNELQFLSFLARKAEFQNERPIEYICKVMGKNLKNRKNCAPKQGFILENDPFYTSTYDRIVLNLCHFPKNNPQHYLIGQILDQVKYLKNDGYLFVLSSKKLFVPSLRERLDTIFVELKTEAIFDLENVKGKGELGSFIYVFRKKHGHNTDKQLCSYFRISANLESFQHFSNITEHLRSFYLANLSEMPPMAHLEFQDSFRVEYFQEAVVNGMLIHSTNEDSSRITHPAFFKSLLDSCVPLEHLFEINSLNLHEAASPNGNALNIGLKQDLSYFLTVDFRRGDVGLELHPMATLRSIHSEYGESLCSYFRLNPKISGLNPNIIRNYFLTPIGKQIANLTFTGGHSLVKGSLSKLLLPKFLTASEKLPEHFKKAFEILDLNEDQLLAADPQTILNSYNHIDQIAHSLFPKYSCEILSKYTLFESNIKSLIRKIDEGRLGHKISFNNPMIQSLLVKKPTRPMYPENDDIYIEFTASSTPADLHLPFTGSNIKITIEGDLKLTSLELMGKDKVIARLHAEEAMVLFIHFLLSHAHNLPISKIIKAVHVPRLSDLKEVIQKSTLLKSGYEELLKNVQSFILSSFTTHVTPKRV